MWDGRGPRVTRWPYAGRLALKLPIDVEEATQCRRTDPWISEIGVKEPPRRSWSWVDIVHVRADHPFPDDRPGTSIDDSDTGASRLTLDPKAGHVKKSAYLSASHRTAQLCEREPPCCAVRMPCKHRGRIFLDESDRAAATGMKL